MFQNRTNNGNLFAVARQKTVGIQDGITERRCCHQRNIQKQKSDFFRLAFLQGNNCVKQIYLTSFHQVIHSYNISVTVVFPK